MLPEIMHSRLVREEKPNSTNQLKKPQNPTNQRTKKPHHYTKPTKQIKTPKGQMKKPPEPPHAQPKSLYNII